MTDMGWGHCGCRGCVWGKRNAEYVLMALREKNNMIFRNIYWAPSMYSTLFLDPEAKQQTK